MIRCKNCRYFAQGSIPYSILKQYENLWPSLPKEECHLGLNCGSCNNLINSLNGPILTNANGYCHRARRK